MSILLFIQDSKVMKHYHFFENFFEEFMIDGRTIFQKLEWKTDVKKTSSSNESKHQTRVTLFD